MKFKFFQNIILIMIGLFVLFFQYGCGKTTGTLPVPTITNINGGLSGSGTVGSLFIINGSGFGELSKQTNGYSVDFRDATTEDIISTASIDYASGDWKTLFIIGVVPGALDTSTTYKVTVTTPGGTSDPVNFLVVASVSFSPSTIAWDTTSSLPQAQQGFPTVLNRIGTTSYIYAIGGNTATVSTPDGKASNVSAVYFNRMNNADGTIKNAAWTAAAALPEERGFATAVVANSFNSMVSNNGVIYLLGGLNGSGNATNTVYYGTVNPDGTINSWEMTEALPQTLFAAGAEIFHGRIYVAGGNDAGGTPVEAVYSAGINSDGSLDSWQALPELPEPRAYHQLVAVAGYLYVIGGESAAVDPISDVSVTPQDTIYYNQIDLRDGSLVSASWTTNSSTLSKKREKHTAAAAGSYILVSGGLYNAASTGSSEQSYATINTDGSVGSFQGATGSRTISGSAGGYNFFNHSTAYFVDESGNPHVLILGGEDVNTGLSHAEVWYQH